MILFIAVAEWLVPNRKFNLTVAIHLGKHIRQNSIEFDQVVLMK